MRLIDADALKEKTTAHGEKIAYTVSFLWDIDDSPTIDAVPVVRCGECNSRLHLCTFDDGSEHFQCTNDKSPCFFAPELLGTDYCPYGERRENAPCP